MAAANTANRRFFLRHPWQLALAVVGIAIGVATAVSVALAVNSARHAFDSSMAALLGPHDAPDHSQREEIDESLYPRLRRAFPSARFVPVVEDLVEAEVGSCCVSSVSNRLPAGERQKIGVQRRRRRLICRSCCHARVRRRLARSTAEHLGIAPGDSLALAVRGQPQSVEILGYVERVSAADPALRGC